MLLSEKKDIYVTVIVLTLNSEKYIARCLDSLEKQTLKEFEVIVVDAGSIDLTVKLVKSYADKFNIRLIIKKNCNMGVARNIGIANSVGEYICFCDSDDYFFPDKLKIQYMDLLKNPTFNVSYYNVSHFKASNKENFYHRHAGLPSGLILKTLLKKQSININSLLIKKSKNLVFFPSDCCGKYGEDWQFLLSLALAGNKFLPINKSYSAIEERTDSHTSWNIQYLAKECILKFLFKNRAAIKDKKHQLDNFFLFHIYYKNIFKFWLACCASNKSEYFVDSKLNLLKPLIFQSLYKCLCYLIFNRLFFRRFLIFFWNFSRTLAPFVLKNRQNVLKNRQNDSS